MFTFCTSTLCPHKLQLPGSCTDGKDGKGGRKEKEQRGGWTRKEEQTKRGGKDGAQDIFKDLALRKGRVFDSVLLTRTIYRNTQTCHFCGHLTHFYTCLICTGSENIRKWPPTVQSDTIIACFFFLFFQSNSPKLIFKNYITIN